MLLAYVKSGTDKRIVILSEKKCILILKVMYLNSKWMKVKNITILFKTQQIIYTLSINMRVTFWVSISTQFLIINKHEKFNKTSWIKKKVQIQLVECKSKNWTDNIWATSWENLFLLYAKNKGADQPAHPRNLISTFVVRCLNSIIPLLSKSKISRL